MLSRLDCLSVLDWRKWGRSRVRRLCNKMANEWVTSVVHSSLYWHCNRSVLPAHCVPLQDEPYMNVQILRMGRGNEGIPHGTKIKVTCSRGYGLNIAKSTAKCSRGQWKPRTPECVTCKSEAGALAHQSVHRRTQGPIFPNPLYWCSKEQLSTNDLIDGPLSPWIILMQIKLS